MKKIPFILALLLVFQFSVISSSASLRPYISTEMPSTIEINLEDVHLIWYIIDDNPKSYSLYINNSIWKNNVPLLTNYINVTFSNPPGFYNVTLTVVDYSGFQTSTNLYIHVNNISASNSSSSTNVYNSGAASPGFELIDSLISFISISIVLVKRKIKRQG